MQWTVGEAKITSIIEQDLGHINDLIRGAKKDVVKEIDWLKPHFMEEDGNLVGLVQAFIIELGGKTLMVDTCVGDGKDLPVNETWHKAQFRFLEKFKQAGFDPHQVDVVLCTHLHLDHVGWNTYWDGAAWAPTFPKARYLFAREEFTYWDAQAKAPTPDLETAESRREYHDMLFAITQARVHAESVQPVFDAGLADLVDIPCEPVPGITLVPTPGHTPGHCSVRVTSGGKEALITGDCFHHPCQIAHPEWWASPDTDNAQSIRTRQEILERMVDTEARMFGTHFARPTVGTIIRHGDRYRLKTD